MNQFSSATRPDLDWSQVRETVRLLTVSVAQVDKSMKVGDKSVNTLTESFADMVGHIKAIDVALATMDESDTKQTALQHCQATREKIQNSIIAFQFYDRLQQCLEHVSQSLKGLSELVEDPARLYNPGEWTKFQESIRSRYTMESEKVMFDAIMAGKTVEEALESALNEHETVTENSEIELF